MLRTRLARLVGALRVVRTVHAGVGKWLGPPRSVPLMSAVGASRSARRGCMLTLPNYAAVALRENSVVIKHAGHRWVHTFEGAPLTCMAAAGIDGVVVGAADGTLRLIRLVNPRITMHFKFGVAGDVPVTHVLAVGHDAFVSALRDGTIRMWAFDRMASERSPVAGLPPVTGLERISEGRVLVRYEGGYEDELQV